MLVAQCVERFLSAMRLLEIRGEFFGRLEARRREGGDLSPLVEPWRALSQRYRDEIFDPQLSLLEDPEERLRRNWQHFVHRALLPTLLLDDEFVRNVLRALDVLPTSAGPLALAAVRSKLQNMTLPEATPPWCEEVA